jgi:hypothetical protein
MLPHPTEGVLEKSKSVKVRYFYSSDTNRLWSAIGNAITHKEPGVGKWEPDSVFEFPEELLSCSDVEEISLERFKEINFPDF